MYKDLEITFNQKQLDILRGKMWWVADSQKPYLIKYASDQDSALLQLTDLRSLWIARIHTTTLMEEKARYARSLEVKDSKDFLALFQALLTSSDNKALYIFKETGTDLHFTYKKRLEIYDFNWTFKLQKTNCNPVQLVCRELLSPLASVLRAQTNRIEFLKKRFQQLEKQYLRKVSEMEKALYISPLTEGEEDWLNLIPKFEGSLLSISLPDKACKYFFSNWAVKEKKQERILLPSFPVPKEPSVVESRFQPKFEQPDNLMEHLEKEREKKKKKQIDFI